MTSLSAPASWRLTILAAGLIVLAAAAVYLNSFAAVFVLDDGHSIVENRTIRRLWPIWSVLSPPSNGETVSGRPLLNFTLAINYAISGLKVWSYHATNLLIHVAAALLLMGILRRTFLTPMLRDRFGTVATPLALATALLWVVHPLQTESVTYIIQRAESLSGLFYLLTLYCVIRGAGKEGVRNLCLGLVARSLATSPLSLWERVRVRVLLWKTQTMARVSATSALAPALAQREREMTWPALLWYAAAVLACLLGTACKEILVTAPLVVLLYDRTFLAGSFAEAWRRRWGLYVALAATWGLLIYLVLSTGLIGRQGEMGAPDPWSYARTQPSVVLHYLRLSFWPSPLCLAENWPVVGTFWEFLPGAMVLGLLVAATFWGLCGRRAGGFLGAWFLLILAPTSSILPLGQVAYEHRMYLPLAAVVVLAVAGGYALCDRLLPRPAGQGGPSPFSPAMTLGRVGFWEAKKGTVPGRGATVVRWAVPAAVWAAALVALGCATVARNSDYRSLLAIWKDCVDKRPSNPAAHNNLGAVLAAAGRFDPALQRFHEALRLRPDYAEAHNNLGNALTRLGRTDEALEHLWRAVQLKPDYANAHHNLGLALAAVGRTDEALQQYQETLRLNPDFPEAHNNLGVALAKTARTDEAIEHFQQALRLHPDSAEAHNNLGIALAKTARTDEAIEHYRAALRLAPDFAAAHYNLARALANASSSNESAEHYRKFLELMPHPTDAPGSSKKTSR